MQKIGLVVKKTASKARLAAEELKVWLKKQGLDVFVDEVEVTINSDSCPIEQPSPIPADVNLIVVLGGDGTLLYAARAVSKKGAPLLGVNLGGLGFLTEIGLKDLYPTMEKVLTGEFRAEERMMLTVTVLRSGESIAEYTVLNDGVINKAALARILDLKVKINGKNLTAFRADGLIISTPTGSTAYNLSAGGPVVYPTHESILLTPICPFTLSNRPLILPETAKIEVEVAPEASDLLLTADGQAFCNLQPGDIVIAERADNSISLIKNPYKNYFEILKTKLGWG